jgi:hypothetical protein
LQKQLSEVVGKQVNEEDVLRYCLAFLNSKYAQERLTTGRRPTPKGAYAVTEEYLGEIPIPPPPKNQTTVKILDLVDKLVTGTDEKESILLETDLARMANNIIRRIQ